LCISTFNSTYEDADFVEEDKNTGLESGGVTAIRNDNSSWGGADAQDTSAGGGWGVPVKVAAPVTSNDGNRNVGTINTPAQEGSSGGDWGVPAFKAPLKVGQDNWAAAANW
jgi:hypothetical protein